MESYYSLTPPSNPQKCLETGETAKSLEYYIMFKSATEIYFWHHDPDSIAFLLRMELRGILQTVYRLCALLEPVNQYWGEATFSFSNIRFIMVIMIIFSYSNILVMIMVFNYIWKYINKSNKWRKKSSS